MKQYNDKYLVPSVLKSAAIIQAVASSEERLKMQDLSQLADCSKSHLFALLNTLCECNWLRQNADNSFSIGKALVDYATTHLYPLELVRHFHAELNKFRKDLRFTYQMSILEGRETVYLAILPHGEAGRIVTFPGVRKPAHCTAMGKVLLAQYSDASLEKIYPCGQLEQVTPRTVANLEELHLQITEFRQSGFMLEVGETKTGYSCVAAPVYNSFGHVAAAVSMSTAIPYPSPEHELAATAVQDLCRSISANMGYKDSSVRQDNELKQNI